MFFQDRRKLNELSKQVAKVIQYYYHRKNKSKRYEVGVITVIHTSGRDLKFNPHIHSLTTEGALDRNKEWKKAEFISYEYLRKSWQKLLLDLMMKWYPKDEREAVFERFYTGANGVTGLGLAICRQIAVRLNGERTYSRSELGGARFSFRKKAGN